MKNKLAFIKKKEIFRYKIQSILFMVVGGVTAQLAEDQKLSLREQIATWGMKCP